MPISDAAGRMREMGLKGPVAGAGFVGNKNPNPATGFGAAIPPGGTPPATAAAGPPKPMAPTGAFKTPAMPATGMPPAPAAGGIMNAYPGAPRPPMNAGAPPELQQRQMMARAQAMRAQQAGAPGGMLPGGRPPMPMIGAPGPMGAPMARAPVAPAPRPMPAPLPGAGPMARAPGAPPRMAQTPQAMPLRSPLPPPPGGALGYAPPGSGGNVGGLRGLPQAPVQRTGGPQAPRPAPLPRPPGGALGYAPPGSGGNVGGLRGLPQAPTLAQGAAAKAAAVQRYGANPPTLGSRTATAAPKPAAKPAVTAKPAVKPAAKPAPKKAPASKADTARNKSQTEETKDKQIAAAAQAPADKQEASAYAAQKARQQAQLAGEKTRTGKQTAAGQTEAKRIDTAQKKFQTADAAKAARDRAAEAKAAGPQAQTTQAGTNLAPTTTTKTTPTTPTKQPLHGDKIGATGRGTKGTAHGGSVGTPHGGAAWTQGAPSSVAVARAQGLVPMKNGKEVKLTLGDAQKYNRGPRPGVHSPGFTFSKPNATAADKVAALALANSKKQHPSRVKAKKYAQR